MQNEALELDEKPQYSKKDRWSTDGIECFKNGAHCETCPLYLSMGMHKNGFGFKRCHQIEANKALIAAGVPLPVVKKAEPLPEIHERQPKCTPAQMKAILSEIIDIVRKLGNPTLREIIAHLNTQYDGAGFLGRKYNAENLHNQTDKLVARGLLAQGKRKQLNYYSLPAEPHL